MQNVTEIPAGSGGVHYHAKVDSPNGDTRLSFVFSTAALDGVTGKTAWFAATGDEINTSDDFDSFDFSGILTQAVQLTTSTIVIMEIYGQTTSVADKTITWVCQSSSMTPYVNTPINSAPTFLSLNDTPEAYGETDAGKLVRVNGGTALIFDTKLSTLIADVQLSKLFVSTAEAKIDSWTLSQTTIASNIDVFQTHMSSNDTQHTTYNNHMSTADAIDVDYAVFKATAEALIDAGGSEAFNLYQSTGEAINDNYLLFVSTAEGLIDGIGGGGGDDLGVHKATTTLDMDSNPIVNISSAGIDGELEIDGGTLTIKSAYAPIIYTTATVLTHIIGDGLANSTTVEFSISSVTFAVPLVLSTTTITVGLASHQGVILSSGAGDIYTRDGSGNWTLQTSHNSKGEFILDSYNEVTGKSTYINIERFVIEMQRRFGGQYLFKNETEEDVYLETPRFKVPEAPKSQNVYPIHYIEEDSIKTVPRDRFDETNK